MQKYSKNFRLKIRLLQKSTVIFQEKRKKKPNTTLDRLEEVAMRFNGNKLKELRLLKGWSRFELANLLDVSEQAVWQFEIKNIKPDNGSTMLKLLQIFDVSFSYFFSEDTVDVVNLGSI